MVASVEPRKGHMITMEGPDKCGKSTQAKLLVDWLQSRGYNPILLDRKSSYIGAFVTKINREDMLLDPPSKALLHALDYTALTSNVVRPALKEGKIIVCDRWIHSSIAYGIASGLPIEWIKEIHRFVDPPDAVFIIDAPSEVALSRLKKSNDEPRFYDSGFNLANNTREKSFLEFQARVRAQFLRMASGSHNIFLISATDSIRRVNQQIREILKLKVMNLS